MLNQHTYVKSKTTNLEIDAKSSILNQQVNNRLMKMLLQRNGDLDPSAISQIRKFVFGGISNEV